MMLNSSIKNIFFDLGGVLINLDYPGMFQSFKKVGIDPLPHPSELLFINKYEKGQLSTDDFIHEISKFSHSDINPSELIRCWNDLLLDFPLSRYEIVKKLRNQYKVFLISNINELHIEAFEAIFNKQFSGQKPDILFDKIYYSCRIGMRKPEIEIFKYVLKENNLIASETLFIDDVLENIYSAQSLGINTIYLDLQKGMKTEDIFKSL